MLLGMRGNAGVMQQVQESMRDLRRVYGEQLDKNEDTGLLWAGCHWKGDSRELYAFAVAQTCKRGGLFLHLRFAETPAMLC